MLYIDKKLRQSKELPEKVIGQIRVTLRGAGYDTLQDLAKGDVLLVVAHDLPGFNVKQLQVKHPDYKCVYPVVIHAAHYAIIRLPAGSEVTLPATKLSLTV